MSHISTLQVVYDAIFLVIMSVTMFRIAYSLAAMAGSIFTASCICAITSTSCILAGTLHLHHVYACHIYRSSFYLFWGQPCGCIWYAQPWFVPHITSVRTICTAAPCEFLLLSFTTSGGMFFMAFSTLKALLPDFIIIFTIKSMKFHYIYLW